VVVAATAARPPNSATGNCPPKGQLDSAASSKEVGFVTKSKKLQRKPMNRPLMFAACALVAFSTAAKAAEVTETVDTTASPKAVWKLIGKFDGIVNWLPGVVSSPADKGNKIGSVRTITLKSAGGPTVVETLTARKRLSYSYKIDTVDPKVLPVTGYTSTIAVTKTPTGSTVTWHGDFTPAGGLDDAASEKAVSGLYRSGLDNIKTLVEK
jgi:uncharacterized protein YndB with AHSA1/START domain